MIKPFICFLILFLSIIINYQGSGKKYLAQVCDGNITWNIEDTTSQQDMPLTQDHVAFNAKTTEGVPILPTKAVAVNRKLAEQEKPRTVMPLQEVNTVVEQT